jgi:hypothetical protein
MTHTLHRFAGNADDLHDDYTVLCMAAKGYNRQGARRRLRRFLELGIGNGAVNFGEISMGNRYVGDVPALLGGVRDSSVVHVVFAGEAALERFLADLVREDLGLSVVVQGVCDRVFDVMQRVGLRPHTTNHSLGVWGHRDRLPDADCLRITTMCGHGLVAHALVKELVGDIRSGRRTVEEAAAICARQCMCGVFNPVRAERLFRELADPELQGT